MDGRVVSWVVLMAALLTCVHCWSANDLNPKQLEIAKRLWHITDQRDFPIPLIFPGTKWCGDGDVAANYSDLGLFAETDKCCRAHDHCPEWMAGFTTNATTGLHNTSPFTRCICDCDVALRSCLRAIDSPVSNAVGTFFADILQIKCFKKDYPVIGCTRYAGLLDMSCQDYVFDTTKAKIWEFFDSTVYQEDTTEYEFKA